MSRYSFLGEVVFITPNRLNRTILFCRGKTMNLTDLLRRITKREYLFEQIHNRTVKRMKPQRKFIHRFNRLEFVQKVHNDDAYHDCFLCSTAQFTECVQIILKRIVSVKI